MKVLVSVEDKVLEDQIRVGLEAFEGLQSDYATGLDLLDRVRRCEFAFLLLELESCTQDGLQRLEQVHTFNPELEVVIIASDSVIRRLKEERARGKIFGFMRNPLVAVEFFRGMTRALKHVGSMSTR